MPSPVLGACVGQYRYREDRAGVPFKGAQSFAGREIPQPQGGIAGPREGASAVFRQRDRAHPVGVALEDPQGLAGPEIPQAQRVVV